MVQTVTRVNGLRNLVGTMFMDNCNAYLITVKIANATAVDLQAEDDGMDEVVEQILKEINPLAFYMPADNSGKIHVIMDKSVNDATELRTRIRNVGKPASGTVTAVGPNSIDISGTTVTLATSLTIA
jgi:hypothetical protein